MRLRTILLILPVFVLASNHIFSSRNRQIIGQQDPDYMKNTEQVILSRGFGYEFHTFVCPDGFVIGIHRIINPFRQQSQTRGTVLMFHGFSVNPNSFLVTGSGGGINSPPGISSPNLGFEIARIGFDVWLLEQRGLPYSSNNTRYTRTSNEYWNWSLDDIAFYDLAGGIEYIRKYTGRDQIGYVGYSQGNAVMFYLLSMVPKYNNIIKPNIALAPAFYQADQIFTRSALLRQFPYYQFQAILKRSGGPFVTYELAETMNSICSSFPIVQPFCDFSTYVYLTFFSPLIIPVLPNIRPDKLSVYETTTVSLTLSARQTAQLFQNVMKNRPAMLDLTPEENIRLYGSAISPTYDAGKITCPYTALFTAINDVVADPKDVEQLRERLPVRPIYEEIINVPSFGHSTFVYGDANTVIKYVVRPVLSILNSLY